VPGIIASAADCAGMGKSSHSSQWYIDQWAMFQWANEHPITPVPKATAITVLRSFTIPKSFPYRCRRDRRSIDPRLIL
jgi:hypothetical protein